MSFTVNSKGYYLYQPSWQQEPGTRMRQMNRTSWESYNAGFSALNSNLLSAVTNQSASMLEITTKIVQERLQADFSKKLDQAKAGLDVTI